MLLIDHVHSGLLELSSAYRRKISREMEQAYHQVLSRHLEPGQFDDAVQAVLEHEKSFPAPATMLMYGRASSRNRWERGEPYVDDTPLRELLDQVEDRGMPLPPTDVQFKNQVERLTFEDAVFTQGIPKTNGVDDEGILDGIRAIAVKAKADLAKMAEIEKERRAT